MEILRNCGLAVILSISLAVALAIAGSESSMMSQLTGFQQVPPILTTGNGAVELIPNASGTSIAYTLYYTNLKGTPTVAHIHFGGSQGTGGIIAVLCGDNGKPACRISGTLVGNLVADDIQELGSQGITQGDFTSALDAIRSGATYADVHSNQFPAGEIRGELQDTAPCCTSGIQGKVVLGPRCPVIVTPSPGGQNCQDQPYQAEVVIRTQAGSPARGGGDVSKEVARFSSNSKGEFLIPLHPGDYWLRGTNGNEFPLARPQLVKVEPGKFTSITFVFDTGRR